MRVKQNELTYPESCDASESGVSKINPGEVIIGTIVGLTAQGQALVEFQGNNTQQPLSAISTLAVTQKQVGRQAALLFTDGDVQHPVIMGLIHSPLQEMLDNYEMTPVSPAAQESNSGAESASNDLLVDGRRIVLEGKDEIVLRCGESSITLTRAGKILIRGKYLLNRATGVNRIMGGSVQVN